MSRPDIDIARAYDEAGAGRARLLVDRVWPRGIPKEDLEHDDWIREIAPASELRKWFDHDAETWDGFRKRYREELDTNGAAVERCLGWCRKGPVTLLFAAKHREHNLTVILRDCLVKRIDR